MSDKYKLITIRIPEEKWDELEDLAKGTGIGRTTIARAGLYDKMAELKRTKAAA